MNTGRQTGFTIVEVMLFLGITGLIMAFMLTGIGSQLNQRRYQDAANSLVDYLQGQYDLVANVNNSRENVAIDGCGDATTTRGMSDCTVVGRILHAGIVGQDTTQVTSTWVIAKTDVTTLPDNAADKVVLTAANLVQAVSDDSADSYSMQWGTHLVTAATPSQALSFTMLIVRVPTSGVIHTYVNTGRDLKPSDVVAASDNLAADFKLCVDPVGLLGVSADPAGALVQNGATNSGGVQFVGQGDCK